LDVSVEMEEAVLHNEGDIEGFLRLVQFKNVEQQQIRSGAHAWDAGGIFDINIRTKDMSQLYREFQKEGWNGYADPHRYVFGIYDVSEVLLKGPDGITIAAMQRYSPALEGFDQMKKTSRIFNSSTISLSLEATRDFFINKLGFHMFFQTAGDKRSGTTNVLGFPQSINPNVQVPIDIVRPDIDNYGSIEYLEPKELKGKDCSTLAKPPNLGILMLRFPVKDADAYANQIQKNGVKLNSEVKILNLDGVWLEFIQLIE